MLPGLLFDTAPGASLPNRVHGKGSFGAPRSPQAESSLRAAWALTGTAQKLLAAATAGKPQPASGKVYAVVRQWIASNGSLGNLLRKEGEVDWITAAPTRIYRQFCRCLPADTAPAVLSAAYARQYARGIAPPAPTGSNNLSLSTYPLHALRDNAAGFRTLLRACMEDLSVTDAQQLTGLPLLLMADGSVRVIGPTAPGKAVAVLDSLDGRALLSSTIAPKAISNTSVRSAGATGNIDLFIHDAVATLLRPWALQPAAARVLGISVFTPQILGNLLPKLLPPYVMGDVDTHVHPPPPPYRAVALHVHSHANIYTDKHIQQLRTHTHTYTYIHNTHAYKYMHTNTSTVVADDNLFYLCIESW